MPFLLDYLDLKRNIYTSVHSTLVQKKPPLHLELEDDKRVLYSYFESDCEENTVYNFRITKRTCFAFYIGENSN